MIVFGLFLLFTGTSVQIIINADNERRTWRDANSTCNLLGSNKTGLFSKLPNEYQDHVPPDGKMHWIAAIKKMTSPFKLSRCVKIDGKNANKIRQNTVKPVYDCYEFCSGSSFALSSNKCACTNTGQFSACNITLFRNTEMDFYSTSSYLLYSTIGASYLNGDGDCAAVILEGDKIVGLSHEFHHCNKKLPSVCNNRLEETEVNWTAAVINCGNKILQSSFNGVYELENRPLNTSWTGISRRSIKQWSNGIFDNITNMYRCLAVSKNSTNKEVQIHVKNCSDLLPSLCEQADSALVSSTQLTTSEDEAISFDVTNFSDVTTIDTTTVIPQNTPVSNLNTSPALPAEQETTPSNSLIPPIVGGAAGGLFIILMIVLIVLYKRFQQKNNNKVNRHSSGAVYSEINKSRQKSSTGIDGAAEQDGTDDSYDHTVNRKSRQSVHSVQENMYDHTTAPQKEPAEDNFYDSTCRNPQKDTIINDNEYGSVNPATGNDVYSHTNQVFSSSDTDVENYDSMNNLK